MSGAGRGTPRVSPITSNLPEAEGYNIAPIPSALFIATRSIGLFGGQALTDSYETYVDGVSSLDYETPLGSLRGAFSLSYENAISPAAELHVRLMYTDGSAAYPTANGSADALPGGVNGNAYEVLEPTFKTKPTGLIKVHFYVPIGVDVSRLTIEVKEEGAASAGVVNFDRLMFDNLQPANTPDFSAP